MAHSASPTMPVSQQDTKAPMTFDGQEITAKVGRVEITIIRQAADRYRVVTMELGGRAVPCWTTTFTADRIAMDTTVEQAARNFARAAFITFYADFETPRQVAQRVRSVAA